MQCSSTTKRRNETSLLTESERGLSRIAVAFASGRYTRWLLHPGSTRPTFTITARGPPRTSFATCGAFPSGHSQLRRCDPAAFPRLLDPKRVLWLTDRMPRDDIHV